MWDMQPDLVNTETNLGDNLIYQYYEVTKIKGYPIKFIKASEVKSDLIFSESTARSFINDNGFNMKSLRDDDTLYTGSETYGAFGYTPSYNQILYIPMKYFTDNQLTAPLEGDIIYDIIDNVFFQISKVQTKTETQTPLRINNLQLAWKVYLKQYTFGYNDTFDTTLKEDIFDDVLDNMDWTETNIDIQTEIEQSGLRDETIKDDVFGEFN